MAELRIRVITPDLRSTLRAYEQLGRGAKNAADKAGQGIAEELVTKIRVFAAGDSRQSARASETVRAQRGRPPQVTAGGAGSPKANAILRGSEFGATRKFGWYRRGRYYNSVGKQFRPHLGAGSYWFFRTYEANKDEALQKYADALDELAIRWGGA